MSDNVLPAPVHYVRPGNVLLRNAFGKALWDARRSLLGWTVAIVAVAAGYGAFWPYVQSPEMAQALEAYPKAVLDALDFDLLTAAGYLRGSVYGLLVPLLLAIFAISAGTRTIAGDEESGTLDLVLAHPVSRGRLAVQRFAAVVVQTFVIYLLLLLAMLALTGPAGFDGVTATEFAATNLQLALFGVCFGALAFAIGAATGSRSLALWGSAAVAVLAYVAKALVAQVDGLDWVRKLSPFDWFIGGDPLSNGLQATGSLLLLGSSVVLFALGALRFANRDLSAGG